jgi:hypothetical protein
MHIENVENSNEALSGTRVLIRIPNDLAYTFIDE